MITEVLRIEMKEVHTHFGFEFVWRARGSSKPFEHDSLLRHNAEFYLYNGGVIMFAFANEKTLGLGRVPFHCLLFGSE